MYCAHFYNESSFLICLNVCIRNFCKIDKQILPHLIEDFSLFIVYFTMWIYLLYFKDYLLTYSWALQPFVGLGLADDPPPYDPILGCRFHILDSEGFQVSLNVIIRGLPLGLFPSGDFSQTDFMICEWSLRITCPADRSLRLLMSWIIFGDW